VARGASRGRVGRRTGLKQVLIFRIALDDQVETAIEPNRPAPTKGAFRDRHGRRERDAVDAAMSKDERAWRGRRSRVVLAPRRWRQVLGKPMLPRDDGGKKARSPGRARRKPLKPSARGMPGAPGVIRGDLLVCFFQTAREAAGASRARHSLRPFLARATNKTKPRAERSRRDRVAMSMTWQAV
jgi:hypothetical protein